MFDLKNFFLIGYVYGDGNIQYLEGCINRILKCLKNSIFKDIIVFYSFNEESINSYKEKYPYIKFVKIKNIKNFQAYYIKIERSNE